MIQVLSDYFIKNDKAFYEQLKLHTDVNEKPLLQIVDESLQNYIQQGRVKARKRLALNKEDEENILAILKRPLHKHE